jgi:hypothetical protein
MKFINKMILISLLVMNSAIAAFPIIDVQNISGDYLDGNGTAYAEKAFYVVPKVKIAHKDITIEFNKKQKSLIINDPSTTVELEFDFSFMNVFKAFTFNNLDIKSDAKLFKIDSERLELFIAPKKYNMEEFYIETDVRNIPAQDDEDITIVDGLVLNAAMSIKKIEFAGFDDVVFDDIRIENPTFTTEANVLAEKARKTNIPMIVRHVDYTIKEGKFAGKAKIDSYINLWLRLNGIVKTNKDNTILDIHLTRAKLGFFSIKGTILKMVRNLKLDGVVVKGNHIIVDVSTVVVGGRRQTEKP